MFCGYILQLKALWTFLEKYFYINIDNYIKEINFLAFRADPHYSPAHSSSSVLYRSDKAFLYEKH